MWCRCPLKPKETVRSPELELQIIVSHYVSSQNRIWDLWKNSQCS